MPGDDAPSPRSPSSSPRSTQITWPASTVVAVGDLHVEHRSLHRADDRACRPPPRRRAPARAAAARARDSQARARATLTSTRRPSTSPARPARRAAPPRPRRTRRRLVVELLRARRQLLRLDDAVARLAREKHGCESSALWNPSSVLTPPIRNSSSARSIRRRRVVAVGAVHDQLRDHRVVQTGDLGAGRRRRSRREPRPGRLAVARDRPGRRAGTRADGSSALIRHSIAWPRKAHVLLAQRERLAERDPDLRADEVEPGDELGDGVLDLDARVHLHEEVVAVRREQALDRPGGAVAGGARRVDGDLRRSARAARRRPPATASPRRASGGGAGSCSRARRGGSRCRARRREPAPRRAAGPRGSARRRRTRRRSTTCPSRCGRLERLRGLVRRVDRLHALAAAARRRLDQERIAELLAERDDLFGRADRLGRAGDDRDARRLHRLRGRASSTPSARSRRAAARSRRGRRPRPPARTPRSRRGTHSPGESPLRPSPPPPRGASRRRGSSRPTSRRRARTPRRRSSTCIAARSTSE